MKDSFGRKLVLVALVLALLSLGNTLLNLRAQNNAPTAGATPTQAMQALPYLTPISATAAVANATTLTIPAPPAGQYNYVCSLTLEGSNDNTATVVTNAVSTSTNFNSFATKISTISAASNDTGLIPLLPGFNPAGGCPKSTSPGTATTFVSPNSTHEAWTWTATYYQGF